MNTRLISVLLAGATLFGAAGLQAQDKQTLDLLVSKGVITKEEAANLSKSAVTVTAKEKATKKLTFSGRVQTQYQFIDSQQRGSSAADTASVNGFQMRRIYLGLSADMGSGWSGTIVLDMAASNYLDNAFITKKVELDYLTGKVDMGYRKVNFGFEETTSSSKLKSIERSVATRFFVESEKAYDQGNLGFGSHYTGAFWDGEVTQLKGLKYGLAVTDSANKQIKPGTASFGAADNSVNVWANTGYSTEVEGVGISFGVNVGYGNGANQVASGNYSSIAGLNPYIDIKYEGLTVWSEYFLASVEDGKGTAGNYQNAAPQGVNVGAEYKFDIGEMGALGPTIRYSYLDTDGRGMRVGDVISGSANPAGSNAYYDNAQSVYIGINWYIMGENVKLQAGYEWAEFNDPTAGTAYDAYSNAVRMQMQILF